MHEGLLHRTLSCGTVPGEVRPWSGTQGSALVQWHESWPASRSQAMPWTYTAGHLVS